MPPTIEEVRSILPPPTDDTDAVEVEEVLWGPISPADARAAGAPFASSSILLRPGIDPELRTRVLAEVPLDVIPSGDDTVATFVARLSSSSFLEDSHVQKSGCLKKRVRLNATSYAQPRRRSWSVQVGEPYTDDDGDVVSTLMSYSAFGRVAEDWEARLMPRPVFDLGVVLWRIAFRFLTAESQVHAASANCLPTPALLQDVWFQNGAPPGQSQYKTNAGCRERQAVARFLGGRPCADGS